MLRARDSSGVFWGGVRHISRYSASLMGSMHLQTVQGEQRMLVCCPHFSLVVVISRFVK